MRKLKLQIQMTLDGFIAGNNGEMDWMKFPWTTDINTYVQAITASVDTVILGRKLAEGFIPHWENVAKNPEDPDYESGIKYTTTPKIVFSETLTQSPWQNTQIANGDLVAAITTLKNAPGNDIIAYGGGTFVSALIKNQLIDEFHFFINPSAIGSGMPIFASLESQQNLTFVKANSFDCGIVVLQYVLAKN